jgi:hypothetical protein
LPDCPINAVFVHHRLSEPLVLQSVYQSVYALCLLLREEVLGKDILIQESKDNAYGVELKPPLGRNEQPQKADYL